VAVEEVTKGYVKALRELNYVVEVDEAVHPVEGKKVLIRGVL
jgi:hypothetical protein